jgi:hypothetical protein
MKPLLLFLTMVVSVPSVGTGQPPTPADRAIAAVRNQPDSIDFYATQAVAQYEAVKNDTAGFQLYLKLSTGSSSSGKQIRIAHEGIGVQQSRYTL